MTRAAGSLSVVLAGEAVELLAGRALHWPRGRTLFIADLHLGKAAAFRAGGVAIPRGSTADDLARLTDLLVLTAATHLVILGDFIHAAAGRVAALDAAVTAWRDRHDGVALTLVRGNHDARAGDPPAHWQVASRDAPHPLGPFALCHEPPAAAEGAASDGPDDPAYALCGHVHPGVRLADGHGPGLTLPCFVLGPHRALLPAFGRMTGLARVGADDGETLVAIAGTQLFRLPAARTG